MRKMVGEIGEGEEDEVSCDNRKDLERDRFKTRWKSLILYFLPHGGFLIVLFNNKDLSPTHNHFFQTRSLFLKACVGC
jgi:hypothetical protein